MGQIKTKLNCKFETVELTFQFKTAYEFSKNLVSDGICLNVREISITTNGTKLSLIWMYMLRFRHWTWDSPFLPGFYRIIYWDAVEKLKKGETMLIVKIRIT